MHGAEHFWHYTYLARGPADLFKKTKMQYWAVGQQWRNILVHGTG
jgi:hypothetical protein